jgi:hypothetical protein
MESQSCDISIKKTIFKLFFLPRTSKKTIIDIRINSIVALNNPKIVQKIKNQFKIKKNKPKFTFTSKSKVKVIKYITITFFYQIYQN